MFLLAKHKYHERQILAYQCMPKFSCKTGVVYILHYVAINYIYIGKIYMGTTYKALANNSITNVASCCK